MLVIIGLIAGGVLIGQNLIHAAQLRATLTQIGKLNTAVNTFRDRFNGLPGDLENYAAVGMYDPAGGWGGGGLIAPGLGDGLIEDDLGSFSRFGGEVGTFFADLSLAGLLEINNMVQFTTAAPASVTGPTIATYMLPAAINSAGASNYIWVTRGRSAAPGLTVNAGYNYYHLSQVSMILGAGSALIIGAARALVPVDAASMDNKLDDGVPNTGDVQADDSPSFMQLAPGVFSCSSAAGIYNVAAPGSTYGLCNLLIRTGF